MTLNLKLLLKVFVKFVYSKGLNFANVKHSNKMLSLIRSSYFIEQILSTPEFDFFTYFYLEQIF